MTPDLQQYQHLLDQRSPGDESAALQAWRRQQLALFLAQGFPASPLEAWRHTRLTGWQQRAFTLPSPPHVDMAAYPEYELLIVDGYWIKTAALPPGLSVMDWQTVFAGGTLATSASPDALTALNAAFTQAGIVLRLAPGVQLSQPLRVLWLSSSAAEASLQATRLWVQLGAGSALTLVEETASLAQTGHFSSVVSEINLEAGAQLTHYRTQNASNRSLNLAELTVRQAAGSQYDSVMLALGGSLARQAIQVYLNGPQAQCHLRGLYLGQGRQHLDFHTRIDHQAAACVSRENYRGILADAARAVFSGRIVVHPDAQQTDSNQQNKTLLLSDHAEIDTQPQLEIFADDVKCAHGATVGQLEPEALFYLQARGIALAEARTLLMQAFARQVLQELPDTPAVTRLHTQVIDKLAGASGRG